MKRQACQLSLIIAALAAAPAAFAGSDIVKCVDRAGRVTLTDQQCAPGTAVTRVDTTPAVSSQPVQVERYSAPPPPVRRGKWRAPSIKRTPLPRDIATLKAARAQMMLQDTGKAVRPALAIN